jgi:phosphoribosylformylglycinamidine synthase
MVNKAIVLKAPGTNNDYETYHALSEAGADARTVHVNELIRKQRRLKDYGILVIPGGFSFGDDLGAGKVFSLLMEYGIRNDIIDFIKKGKIVLGVCNGFQVLVKAKLLPGISEKQKITLTSNDSGRFICKWVRLRVKADSFWFKGLPSEVELPIAHAEGKFAGSEEECEKLKNNSQIRLTYIDNPNGSMYDIAGITNDSGNVLGLMPHPERFVYDFQHPAWRTRKVFPWGRRIYKNIIDNA